MASTHLLLLLLLMLAAALHVQETTCRVLAKRASPSHSLSSIFSGLEKRLEAVEASSTKGTEQRLGELEARLWNSTQDGLQELETRTLDKTQPRLAELEAGMEEVKARVSQLQSREKSGAESWGAQPGVPLQGDAREAEPAPAAWHYTSLQQLHKLGPAQLCPDHQRLSKLEGELASLQRALSATGQQAGETSRAGCRPSASRSSKEELEEVVAGLVNASETRLLSALEERLPLHASPAPAEAPSRSEARKRSCEEYLTSGHYSSGVYTLHLSDKRQPIQVFCDMESAGGGWAVIQRRQDGSEDFYRNWKHYQRGFGNLSGEFWLGNDNLHRLTRSGLTRLLVEMENWKGETAQAYYSTFRVGDAIHSYPLNVSGFIGKKGQDALTPHNGQKFSTPDRDNDVGPSLHCAESWKGAWWYKGCGYSRLNSDYGWGNGSGSWVSWQGVSGKLKRTEMKIR